LNPYFFGSSERPLFGVYHQGAIPVADIGVVLCYPVGGEYLRAHRAFRQLTNLLVRTGIHVLRFDYLGTGDSGGDPKDATIEQWTEDVDSAITELKDSTGLQRVSLAGLRLGATLAAEAAFRRSDINRVVLWDPVVDGDPWLEGLIRDEGNGREQDTGVAPQFPEGTVGIGGFPVTPAMSEGIRKLRLGAMTPGDGTKVDLIVSREEPEVERLAAGWRGASDGADRVRYRCIPSEGDWARGDRFGSALIPQAIIQGVIECLRQD